MEIIGFIALGIMGISLGVFGAGGSILTIPILVYLLKIEIIQATSYSLLIVGATSGLAASRYKQKINFKSALLFAAPSIAGVYLVRACLMPNLPSEIGSFSIKTLLTILLVIFMALAGFFMVQRPSLKAATSGEKNRLSLVGIGFALGSVMGILGAGGGFLIIPTLVLLMHLPMTQAVPSSLFIITLNALIGFVADKYPFSTNDWLLAGKFLLFALGGMLIGTYLACHIKGENLKKPFGYFIWIVEILIILKESLW